MGIEPNTAVDRTAAMAAIADQVRVCPLCDLAKTRTHAVPGAGSITSEILFIGEGPGQNEDRKGLPFIGRSGDYLEKLLALIGMTRNDVFITNVVKCRPPENRDPTNAEIAICRPYLDSQEALLDPLVIVTLGRFSMGRYFPGGKITQIHGAPKHDGRRSIYPLFHPAAVLRSASLEPTMEADFLRIPALVEEVRQRRAAFPNGFPATIASDEPKEAPAPPPSQMNLF